MKNLLTSIILAIVAGTSLSAQAALVTYTDRASFLAASSGFTTFDFEAQNPGPPASFAHYLSSLTVGSVTFGQPDERLFVFGEGYYPTSLTSNYLTAPALSPNGINVTFTDPVYGVGMDLGILYTFNAPDLSVTFTLPNSDTVTTFAPFLMYSPDSLSFFGFYSDTAFSSFNVNGPSEGVAFDNFSFTSQAPQSPQLVPEPASFALLGLGLFALAANRRRRQINS